MVETRGANSLIDHCNDAHNSGISIWQYQGKKHLTYLTSNSVSIPQFNSNYTYLVISQRSNLSVLGDKGYNSFKIYFWIGSRSASYEQNFQETMREVTNMVNNIIDSRIRIYVEFQYAESPQFFSLFRQQELALNQIGQFSAIQYQEYLRPKDKRRGENPDRAISFPKFLIMEMLANEEQHLHGYVRIYERKALIHSMRKGLIYIYMEGEYKDRKGTVMEDLSSNVQLITNIKKLSMACIAGCSDYLYKFAQSMIEAYLLKFPSLEFDHLQVAGIQDLEKGSLWYDLNQIGKKNQDNCMDDTLWPVKNMLRAYDFTYPYQIETLDWKEKDDDDLDEMKEELQQYMQAKDQLKAEEKIIQDNARFEVKNPYEITFEKGKSRREFDPNNIYLFRISLVPKISTSKQQSVGRKDIREQKDVFGSQYFISFQQLNLQLTDCQMLNNHQMYMVSTPYSLYLWIGTNVSDENKRGTIQLLQIFMRDMMKEETAYQPTYLYDEAGIFALRLRVEIEGYESNKFKSFFKNVWRQDVNDYLMLRRPKANVYVQEEHELLDHNEIEDQAHAEVKDQKVNKTLKSQRTLMANIMADRDDSSEEENEFLQQRGRSRKVTFQEKSRVNARKSSIFMNQDMMMMLASSSEISALASGSEVLDLDKSKKKEDIKRAMIRNIRQSQQFFLEEIQSKFSPLQILQGQTQHEKQAIEKSDKIFDAIWMYEVIGRQFEQIKNPLNVGIFEASKCYFAVFMKKRRVCIYLWRGEDRAYLKKFIDCTELLRDTKFREEKNSLRGKQDRMSMDAVKLTSKLAQLADNDKDLDAMNENNDFKPGLKRSVSDVGYNELKTSFRPISQVQTETDPQKIKENYLSNLSCEKKNQDGESVFINMRSIVTMDQEPMHFLQACQGQFIVTTDDYLKRIPTTFLNDLDENEDTSTNFVMYFQLVGLPSLNQKAREVEPFVTSLKTSGLFILVAKDRVFFWIGSDYYAYYLDEETFKEKDFMISESLLQKLVHRFRNVVLDNDPTKMKEMPQINIVVEGMETPEFWRYARGRRDTKMKQSKKFNQASDNEDSDEYDVELSSEDEDEDKNHTILNFQSKNIKEYLIPEEPQLYILSMDEQETDFQVDEDNEEDKNSIQVASEKLGYKEVIRFNQKSLHPTSVALLDFGSEAMIWIGKKVPQDIVLDVPERALYILKVINAKNRRLNNMTFSVVMQGFEPEVFKQAFGSSWINYGEPTNIKSVIVEESSEDSEDSDEKKKKEDKNQGSQNGIKRVVTAHLVPEDYWVN